MASLAKTNSSTSQTIENSQILAAFANSSSSGSTFRMWSSTALTFDLKINLHNPDGDTGVYWQTSLDDAIRLALADVSSVSNLTFTETDSNADIDFWYYGDSGSTDAGYSYGVDGTGVYINEHYVHNQSEDGVNGLEYGGIDYETVIHEILHNLGVAHPHDKYTNLPGVYSSSDTGTYNLNQSLYSVMSYNTKQQTTADGTPTTGWPYTVDAFDRSGNVLGAFDIAYLQTLYGANYSTATGDDVYVIPDSNNIGTFYKAIWDAAGIDEIMYSGSRDVTIDLRAATLDLADGALAGGGLSKSAGIYGGFTIANRVVIENATGGTGNDTIFGNGANNTLTGNSGNDVIMATFGDNIFYGGTGNDALTAYSGYNYLSGNTGDDFLMGGIGRDYLDGSSGSDVLRGDIGSGLIGGSDTLFGGTNDDILMGGAGGDVFLFNPNDGFDRIGYFASSTVFLDSIGYFTVLTDSDFVSGVDHIELSGFLAVNATNVISMLSDTTDGAYFYSEGTGITFFGVSASEIGVADFIFS